MNDTTASKIAEVLELPAIEVIAAANADREKGKNKAYWENFYKRLGGVAASLAVISITALPVTQALDNTVYYVKSLINRFRIPKIKFC